MRLNILLEDYSSATPKNYFARRIPSTLKRRSIPYLVSWERNFAVKALTAKFSARKFSPGPRTIDMCFKAPQNKIYRKIYSEWDFVKIVLWNNYVYDKAYTAGSCDLIPCQKYTDNVIYTVVKVISLMATPTPAQDNKVLALHGIAVSFTATRCRIYRKSYSNVVIPHNWAWIHQIFIGNKSAYLHVPPRRKGAPIFVHSWSEYV